MSNVSSNKATMADHYAKAWDNTNSWIDNAATKHTTFNVFGLKLPRTALFTDEAAMQRDMQRLRMLQEEVLKAMDKAVNLSDTMFKRLNG